MSGLVLVYASKSGNTGLVAEAIAEGARSMDLDAMVVECYDLREDDLMSADALAIGSPTYEQDMLLPIRKLIDRLDRIKCSNKPAAAFGSYGWSGEAPIKIAEKLRSLGYEVVDPVLRVQYVPVDKELEACKLLGKDIALAVKRSKAIRLA